MSEGKLDILMQENKYDILVEAIVNEAYIELYYKQYLRYTKFTEDSLGEYFFYLNKIEEMQFVDLDFEIENKKIKSKLISKANDENEIYSDSIASGNTTIHIKDDKESNRYLIKIGNIEPGKTMLLKYHFIQKLKSDELNYIYELYLNFPYINEKAYPRSMKANIKFETFNTLTKLEPKIYQKNPKITYKFNGDRKMEAEIIIKDIDYSIYPMISFEFQTKDYEKTKLFSQYDPINNETSFLLRNVEKKENIKTPSGCYYFLFKENCTALKPIILKKILEIFLNLLPEGSYYQIIGLGIYIKFYNLKPSKYYAKNYQKIINKINTENDSKNNNYTYNDFINIDEVFEYIYNSEENNKMPKYIFILNSCYNAPFNMMEKYKIYMNKFHIYEFQFCNFDMKISSLTQNGITSFNCYFDEEQLKEIIKKSIFYINNYYNDVNYDIINKNSIEVLYDFKKDNYLLENQIKNYYFIMKGKINEKIDINYKFSLNNNNLETKLSFDDKNITNIKEGNTLAKIIINKIINNNKNEIVNQLKLLSKKYKILNEYTSLLYESKIQEKISESTNQISLFDNNITDNTNNNKKTSLFGEPALNTYHNKFGSYNPFRNIRVPTPAENNNKTISLFGNQPSGGLFGNTRDPTLNTSGGLFGNIREPTSDETNNQTGSLFGNQPSGSLFGITGDQTLNTNLGLFGNTRVPTYDETNNQTTSLFGNQPSGGLFENTRSLTLNTSLGLFGNIREPTSDETNNQTGSLFGNQPSGGLFGITGDQTLNTSHGLFGNNDNM